MANYKTSHPAYSKFNTVIEKLKIYGFKIAVVANDDIPHNMITFELDPSRTKLVFTVPRLPKSPKDRIAFEKAFKTLNIHIPSISKAEKKFIMIVHEQPRTISHVVEVSKAALLKDGFYTWSEDYSFPDWVFIGRFPVQFREDSEDYSIDWKVTNCKTLHGKGVSAKVSATVPETKTCFFIGQDESHMFISCLPETIKSLSKVDDVLMPEEVKKAKAEGKDIKRQGEFYFVRSDKRISIGGNSSMGFYLNCEILKPFGYAWDRSDHIAETVFVENIKGKYRQFVKGHVGNERHKQLYFSSIYEVFPNKEVPARDALWD